MIENILFMDDSSAKLKIVFDTAMSKDLINLHLVFVDDEKKILAEITEVERDVITVSFLGEFVDGKFIPGTIKKPKLMSTVRSIDSGELDILMAINEKNSFPFGASVMYNRFPYNINVDSLFSNHMAIFGNTGSGKSYGVSKMLQEIFYNKNNIAINSTFLIFDVHGEYNAALSKINEHNENYTFKEFTSNKSENLIKVPLWLLDCYDIGMMLHATSYSQLTIIEKALYILAIITDNDEFAVKFKNHMIAKAIQNIIYSSLDAAKARSYIFEILRICSTEELNLNINISGIGYVRSFKKCFEITRDGTFAEDILITNYIETFINEELENKVVKKLNKCTLRDFEEALNFVIISEGISNNDEVNNNALMLKMKLHSLIMGGYEKHFDYDEYMTKEKFIYKLFTNKEGRKAQIINFNLDEFDNAFASFIIKAISKIVFDYTSHLSVRGSFPINIFMEEAHRFILKETNETVLEDDIFNKIAREGRKYGIILTLISQRPTELSEVILSQCSSFLLFRINHPNDIEHMKKAIPNINTSIIERQRSIQPGYFVGIGRAFAIPMIIKISEPDPTPSSSNVRIFDVWSGNKN